MERFMFGTVVAFVAGLCFKSVCVLFPCPFHLFFDNQGKLM